jgi:hypothetical protein
LLATFSRKPLTEVPIDMAQMKIVIEISAAIRAYSIAVAPERMRRNDPRQVLIRCNIAIPETRYTSRRAAVETRVRSPEMSALFLAVNAFRRFILTLPGAPSMYNLIAQTGLRVLSKNDEFFRNFCCDFNCRRAVSRATPAVWR